MVIIGIRMVQSMSEVMDKLKVNEKGVLSDNGKKMLYRNEITGIQVVEDLTGGGYFINFTNKYFIELENYGIWDELNTIPDIFIGIELYESADIPNRYLEKVLKYLKEDKEGLSKEAKQVIKGMIDLFEEAIEIGVGVYFFC